MIEHEKDHLAELKDIDGDPLEELADWMHYSATGVSTFKRRIAQKIGISARELYHFLHEMLQSEK